MRIYDPDEDLPPTDEKVWGLCKVYTGFGHKEMTITVSFNPRKGWSSANYSIEEVLKWCDAPMVDLAELSEACEKKAKTKKVKKVAE